MIRRTSSTVLAVSLAATSAHAGGVPVIDGASLTQQAQKLEAMARDYGVQLDRALGEGALLDAITAAQAELEAARAALDGPTTIINDLKAAPAYGPAPDPMAGTAAATRLFGTPREGIERRIVRTAEAFAASPGVTALGLSPAEWRAWFQALVRQESAFNPTAESHAGAYGLTQLMPGTAADMGVDRYDIDDNLKGGARYITRQMQTFGRMDHALAAYNAGPGNVRKYGGIPPFKETQNYVIRITGFAQDYIAALGGDPGAMVETDAAAMAAGDAAHISEGLGLYAEDAMAATKAARARLETIIDRIDTATSLKDARALNTAAKAEIGRLFAILSKLRAGRTEAKSAAIIAGIADREANRAYLDWSPK